MMGHMKITEEDLEKKYKLWKILHQDSPVGCDYCKKPSCVHLPFIPIFKTFNKGESALNWDSTFGCKKFLIPGNYKQRGE
jgi:hypothetical protein